MNKHMQSLELDELLNALRLCAKELLLAFDETAVPEFLEAFERTAQACEVLYFSNQNFETIH
ncbi:TPA: hypothetical protein ACTUNV_002626 [Legionella pneumophila]